MGPTVPPSSSAQCKGQISNTKVIQPLGRLEKTQYPPCAICPGKIASTVRSCHLLPPTPEGGRSFDVNRVSAPSRENLFRDPIEPSNHIDACVERLDKHEVSPAVGGSTCASSSRFEKASFHSIIIRNSETSFLPFSWWLGRVNETQVTNDVQVSPDAVRIYQGYGLGFALLLPWKVAVRSELLTYFWRRGSEPSLSFSFDLHLSFPRVVSWETRSVCSTMCGDVEAMRAAFSNKEATPYDVLPDGSTLLHVSSCEPSRM